MLACSLTRAAHGTCVRWRRDVRSPSFVVCRTRACGCIKLNEKILKIRCFSDLLVQSRYVRILRKQHVQAVTSIRCIWWSLVPAECLHRHFAFSFHFHISITIHTRVLCARWFVEPRERRVCYCPYVHSLHLYGEFVPCSQCRAPSYSFTHGRGCKVLLPVVLRWGWRSSVLRVTFLPHHSPIVHHRSERSR
jgi:hypothetical protein